MSGGQLINGFVQYLLLTGIFFVAGGVVLVGIWVLEQTDDKTDDPPKQPAEPTLKPTTLRRRLRF
jgi:hypothetical protein